MTVCMLCFAVASAMADGKVSMETLSLSPGDTKTVSLVLTNDEAWSSMGINILLPEGLSLVDGSLRKNTAVLPGTKQDVDLTEQQDGSWLLTIMSNSSTATFKADGQVLVSFDVVANELLAEYSQIKLFDGNASYKTKTADGKTKVNKAIIEDAASEVINVKKHGYFVLSSSVSDLTLKVGKTAEITISLENSLDFVGFQFDLVLPKGIELAAEEIEDAFATTSRSAKHNVNVAAKSGNTYSVIISSTSTENNSLGNSGNLLVIALKATKAISDQEIKIINAKGSDLSMKKSSVDDLTISVTTEEALIVPSAIEQISLIPGESMEIAVSLENNTPIAGIQGEIVLPEGLEFDTQDDEYLGYTDRLPLSGLKMMPSVEGNKMKFIISSTKNTDFKGQNGELFYFYVKANENFKSNGTIVVSALKVSEKDMTKFDIPNTVEIQAVVRYTDPTMDGEWDIEDIVKILDAQAGIGDATNCDLNNDGSVDIQDIVIALDHQAGIF